MSCKCMSLSGNVNSKLYLTVRGIESIKYISAVHRSRRAGFVNSKLYLTVRGIESIKYISAVHRSRSRSRSFALFCRSRSWSRSLFTSGKTPAALICAANFYHRSTKN